MLKSPALGLTTDCVCSMFGPMSRGLIGNTSLRLPQDQLQHWSAGATQLKQLQEQLLDARERDPQCLVSKSASILLVQSTCMRAYWFNSTVQQAAPNRFQVLVHIS